MAKEGHSTLHQDDGGLDRKDEAGVCGSEDGAPREINSAAELHSSPYGKRASLPEAEDGQGRGRKQAKTAIGRRSRGLYHKAIYTTASDTFGGAGAVMQVE